MQPTTFFPTVEPTPQPTPFCEEIYLSITHFHVFGARVLNSNTQLQRQMTNLTQDAIFLTANNFNSSVGSDEFHVGFQNAFDALIMEQILCAFDDLKLEMLMTIMQNHSTEIASYIKINLTKMYSDSTNSDLWAVKISRDEINGTDIDEVRPSENGWAEENVHWILLIIVMVMVVIMANVVGYLLYRRKKREKEMIEMNMKQQSVESQEEPGVKPEPINFQQTGSTINSIMSIDSRGEGVAGSPVNVTHHDGSI